MYRNSEDTRKTNKKMPHNLNCKEPDLFNSDQSQPQSPPPGRRTSSKTMSKEPHGQQTTVFKSPLSAVVLIGRKMKTASLSNLPE